MGANSRGVLIRGGQIFSQYDVRMFCFNNYSSQNIDKLSRILRRPQGI